ncbi:hypothetical protein FBU30_001973 [Linnemannia zychae]|nr:hypothetical protein FBU30_001973 [Linnemannia zychae]
MDMDIDTSASVKSATPKSAITASTAAAASKPTVLTRLCDSQSEHFYIYLTIEMDSRGPSSQNNQLLQQYNLSILTFRNMLSTATQELFGAAMGGGINIDIFGFWTDASQDPYNRMLFPSPATKSSNIPGEANKQATTVAIKSTYSPTTTASAVLRCRSLDVNQLWNSLMLFSSTVDNFDARFEVRYVSSTLMGLQANSRQLKWSA